LPAKLATEIVGGSGNKGCLPQEIIGGGSKGCLPQRSSAAAAARAVCHERHQQQRQLRLLPAPSFAGA
jgi:hypothetical protein